MEAYALGLGDPIQISAEHGEGMGELYDALRALMPEPSEEEEVRRRRRTTRMMPRRARSASPSSAGPMPANRR